MQESHGEGLTTHPGHPHAAASVNALLKRWRVEAQAGGIEPRDQYPEVPTLSRYAEGNTALRASVSAARASRGQEPLKYGDRPSACVDAPCTGIGRSPGPLAGDGRPERMGKAQAAPP